MTVLEKYKRLQAQRSGMSVLLRLPAMKHVLRNSHKFARTPHPYSPKKRTDINADNRGQLLEYRRRVSLRRRRGFGTSSFDHGRQFTEVKPSLSPKVVELIQRQVLELLRDKRDSCSLFDITSAVMSNTNILNEHAVNSDEDFWTAESEAATDENDPYGLNSLLRRFNPFDNSAKFSNFRKTRNERMQRKYQFINALEELNSQVKSHNVIISSWNNAQEHLEAAFNFPNDETLQNNLTRYHGTSKTTTKADPDDVDSILRRQMVQLSFEGLTSPQRQLLEIARTPSKFKDNLINSQLTEEYEQIRRKSQAVKDIEDLFKQKEQEKEALKSISSLMRPLQKAEQDLVHNVLNSIGPEDEVLYKDGSDSVQRGSMQRLRSGEWLNDEIVHYFLVMLSKRDEALCRQDPSRKRIHFFKSFFFTKLLNEGHANPAMDGTYDYKNVKRWSKKVPGKDVFSLDKIVIPINVGRLHWVCVVAFIQEKRIQFYDSLGDPGEDYLHVLFRYLQDEHMDKKQAPMPNVDQWKLVTCTPDTPHQRNGFDCGVFTCMFADFLSRDFPLLFNQSHVTLCRERIALSIINGQAIM